MKLVVVEPESSALRAFLSTQDPPALSSAVARVEVPRAARRHDAAADPSAVFADLRFVEVARRVLDLAARLEPVELASLDAVHLASALLIGDALVALVTYDHRMQRAAEANGLRVEAPA